MDNFKAFKGRPRASRLFCIALIYTLAVTQREIKLLDCRKKRSRQRVLARIFFICTVARNKFNIKCGEKKRGEEKFKR